MIVFTTALKFKDFIFVQETEINDVDDVIFL